MYFAIPTDAILGKMILFEIAINRNQQNPEDGYYEYVVCRYLVVIQAAKKDMLKRNFSTYVQHE